MRQPPLPNFVPPLVDNSGSASITEQHALELLVHVCKNTDFYVNFIFLYTESSFLFNIHLFTRSDEH